MQSLEYYGMIRDGLRAAIATGSDEDVRGFISDLGAIIRFDERAPIVAQAVEELSSIVRTAPHPSSRLSALETLFELRGEADEAVRCLSNEALLRIVSN